jgi:hypothetical protein
MIGPHIIGSPGEYRELMQRWKPRVALLLDPGEGASADIKRWSPTTFLIGRVYREDGEISDHILADPRGAAEWAASLIRSAASRNPDIDVWQFNNEVVQDTDQIPKLSRFTQEYVRLLAESGLRAAIGCFSVGRPEAPSLDQGAAWKAFAPAMTYGLEHNAVLLLHAYGRPHIFGDAAIGDSPPEWYLQRYERVVRPFLPSEVPEMPYVYGEYGCDMRGGDRGWKTGYGGDHSSYVKDLQEAARFLAQQPNCLGACVYTLGVVNPQWLDFDIRGECAHGLAAILWPWRPKRDIMFRRRGAKPSRRGPTPKGAARPATGPGLQAQVKALAKDPRAKPLADYGGDAAFVQRIITDGFVPTSREFSVRSGGTAYLVRAASHPGSGEDRVYYVRKDESGDVHHVAG